MAMTSTRSAGVPPALPRASSRTRSGCTPESINPAATDCARASAMRRGLEGSSSPAGGEAKARMTYSASAPCLWAKSRNMAFSAGGRSLSCTKKGSVRRSAPFGSALGAAFGGASAGWAAGGAGVVSARRVGGLGAGEGSATLGGGGGAAPGRASAGAAGAAAEDAAGGLAGGGDTGKGFGVAKAASTGLGGAGFAASLLVAAGGREADGTAPPTVAGGGGAGGAAPGSAGRLLKDGPRLPGCSIVSGPGGAVPVEATAVGSAWPPSRSARAMGRGLW